MKHKTPMHQPKIYAPVSTEQSGKLTSPLDKLKLNQ